MIVVDVGCKPWNEDESIGTLVGRFHPHVLFGFDPHPDTNEGTFQYGTTTVVISRMAAWFEDGEMPLMVDGIMSGIDRDLPGSIVVKCFDLAAFLRALPEPVVLKVDAEGAEYPLLAHLAETGTDRLVTLGLIEWHEWPLAHGWQGERPEVSFPIEDWY